MSYWPPVFRRHLPPDAYLSQNLSANGARPSLEVNFFSVYLRYLNFHNNHKIPIYNTTTSREKNSTVKDTEPQEFNRPTEITSI